MRKFPFCAFKFCLVILFLAAAKVSLAQVEKSVSKNQDVAFLISKFSDPGKEFQSAPLWVWNTKVSYNLIDSMMTDFKKNHFGGVFVHPRPGLVTEYLGTDWMKMYAYTIKRAKQLDMNVWIYDESSYPTGFAGGLVNEAMPASYNQGQMLEMTKVSRLPIDDSEVFMCLKKEGGNFLDVTQKIKEGISKDGDFFVFKRKAYRIGNGMVGPDGFSLVDLLVTGVTETFIDLTYEKGYAKQFREEFGKTIPGTFSDEPSIPTHGKNVTRWTPDLFKVFKQRWGYDLETKLPSLYEEVGNWRQVRHNYLQTLLQFFIDRWSKPMNSYNRKNRLKWTGHYWEHGWPDPNDGPDNMAMYAWHEQPGIDMLFNQFNEESPNAQFGNIRSVKELSSVANQLNKGRTLSETYGGGGWDVTFKDLKRLGDWQAVLGVNFLNQHLSTMSLVGARKYDYPPTFSRHSPWWKYYGVLNQYNARLSYVLSNGKQENHIVILEPTTSAWMYAAHTKKHPRFKQIGESFQQFVTKLEHGQVEYDLASENIIKDHGVLKGNSFCIGVAGYKTVVIPPGMENLDRPTFELLKQFVQRGGRLICFERIKYIDGKLLTNGNAFEANQRNIYHFDAINNKVIDDYFRDSGIMFSNTSEKGTLYHHRRSLKGGQTLFLSNADMDSYASGKIELSGKFVYEMNLFNGKLNKYVFEPKNGRVSFSYSLPPAGSSMLLITNQFLQANPVSVSAYGSNENLVRSSESMKIVRPEENTLMIDFCTLGLNGKSFKDIHVSVATDSVFKAYGFNSDPWAFKMQYKQRVVERDTFSRGTGFDVSYKFNIVKNVDFQKFSAVIEQAGLWNSILINGIQVKPIENRHWMDFKDGVLELGKFLKVGENVLELRINPMSVYAEIGPIILLGDFNLNINNNQWLIEQPKPMNPGSWKEQGFPMYGHGVKYSRTFALMNKNTDSYKVRLNQFKGTVAAVSVNGKDAGIIFTNPYELDISSLLTSGTNTIVVEVIGSLKNLYGPHQNNPPKGFAGPWSWRNNLSTVSPAKYDLNDYGLEDIELIHAGNL